MRKAPVLRFLRTLVASAFIAPATTLAGGPSIGVMPVTVQLAPGQMATTLTVSNQGDREIAFQVRAYAWTQPGGSDQLTPTTELLASPPLGTIPAGGKQIMRLILRRPAQRQEASYRILLDQIPPPAEPGTINLALRLSIPIFAAPTTRIAPHVRWRIEREGDNAYLVAANDGGRHEKIQEIALTTAHGDPLSVDTGLSPYLLAGATGRWRLLEPARLPPPGENLRLTARSMAGAIDQSVAVRAPP